MQECVSEFISFITSEASDRCQQEKRKTINGEDLLWAMGTLGFDDYSGPLKVYLQKYRQAAKKGEGGAAESSSEPGAAADLSAAATLSTTTTVPGFPSASPSLASSLPGLSSTGLNAHSGAAAPPATPGQLLTVPMLGGAPASAAATAAAAMTTTSMPAAAPLAVPPPPTSSLSISVPLPSGIDKRSAEDLAAVESPDTSDV